MAAKSKTVTMKYERATKNKAVFVETEEGSILDKAYFNLGELEDLGSPKSLEVTIKAK